MLWPSSLLSPPSSVLCSHFQPHVLALASTNRLIDPKWNTELINTVLMRVCCSITCHLNHPGSRPTSHPFSVMQCTSQQFALSFWEELYQPLAVVEFRTLSPLYSLFYHMLKISAFLSAPVLTLAYSYIFNEVPWMSQMKSKCKPIDYAGN